MARILLRRHYEDSVAMRRDELVLYFGRGHKVAPRNRSEHPILAVGDSYFEDEQ